MMPASEATDVLSADIAPPLLRSGVDLPGIQTMRRLEQGSKARFLRLRLLDEGRGLRG